MTILCLARKRLEISFEMKTCLVVKLFPSPIDNLVKRFCFQKHSMVWFTCFVRCVNQAVKQWDMRYSFSIHPFMYLLYLLSHYSTIMYFWHCLKLWHVAFLTTYNSVWLFLIVCSCRHLVIYANSSTLSFLHFPACFGNQKYWFTGASYGWWYFTAQGKTKPTSVLNRKLLEFTQTKFPFTRQKHTITLNVCIIQIFLSRLVWYSF